MPVIDIYTVILVACDYPQCEYITLVKGIDGQFPSYSALKAEGWEADSGYVLPYPAEPNYFCPDCRIKKLPTDLEGEHHKCKFFVCKKDGTPSDYGQHIRCGICWKTIKKTKKERWKNAAGIE